MIIKYKLRQDLFIFISHQTFASNRRKLVPPLPGSCLFDILDTYKSTMNGERFFIA